MDEFAKFFRSRCFSVLVFHSACCCCCCCWFVVCLSLHMSDIDRERLGSSSPGLENPRICIWKLTHWSETVYWSIPAALFLFDILNFPNGGARQPHKHGSVTLPYARMTKHDIVTVTSIMGHWFVSVGHHSCCTLRTSCLASCAGRLYFAECNS